MPKQRMQIANSYTLLSQRGKNTKVSAEEPIITRDQRIETERSTILDHHLEILAPRIAYANTLQNEKAEERESFQRKTK